MSITIAQIDAAIDALVLNPQVDYTVGDKSFKNSQKLQQLLALRKSLIETPEVELEFVQFDADIDLNGKDNTQTTILQ